MRNIELAYAGMPDTITDRSQVDKLPYASLAVKIGKAPKTLMILARVDGAEYHWVSANRVVMVSRHGRIVRTVDLPQDLARTTFFTQDPLSDQIPHEGTSKFTRLIDIFPDKHFSVPVTSRLDYVGSEEIDILGVQHSTKHWVEHASAPLLDWHFSNHYWLGYDGFVWKSIQHTTPAIEPVTLEITKRPA